MEDNTLAHFEFESVAVTDEDLRRFRAYDAYTGLRYGKPVTTYVICSGTAGRIHSELKEGINTVNCFRRNDLVKIKKYYNILDKPH